MGKGRGGREKRRKGTRFKREGDERMGTREGEGRREGRDLGGRGRTDGDEREGREKGKRFSRKKR